MAETTLSIFHKSVREVLTKWQLPIEPWATTVAGQISKGTLQWQQRLEDGRFLYLLRVYAPVIPREEVFLGNILLNDFLFKAVTSAAQRIGLEQFASVANDLESAYFLACGHLNLDKLNTTYGEILSQQLPDLYFADEDLTHGTHGLFNTMLTFYKANIEPFPVFAIPLTLLPSLLQRVAKWIRVISSEEGVKALADVDHLPDDVAASRRINVILSLLTFFFCLDGAEMQSFHKFLLNGMEDGRFPTRLVKRAFNFSEHQTFSKAEFDKAKKDGAGIDFLALEQAVVHFLNKVEADLSTESNLERFYVGQKMLPHTVSEVVTSLTANMQIGYTTLIPPSRLKINSAGVPCRLCGQRIADIQECHIIGGLNTGKRFNQSLKRNSERFCISCSLSAYLVNKRLGMQFDGGFPVPKLYNVIFHYGQHSDTEQIVFQYQLDYLFEHTKEAEKTVPQMRQDLKAIRQKFTREEILEDLFGDEYWSETSLSVATQVDTSAKAQVLVLGAGFYRLFTFILPQFRHGSKEGIDFVQKRFSKSRLGAFILLALLRGLCGCDGPYFYQSVPQLSGGIELDIFYVQDRPEMASDILRKYGAIVNFARQVSLYRQGHSVLADWVLLAERLLEDPLGVFSDVLKNSPVRSGDEFANFKYKRLSSDWESAKGLGVVNSTAYLALYQQLSEMTKEMNG